MSKTYGGGQTDRLGVISSRGHAILISTEDCCLIGGRNLEMSTRRQI